MESFKYIQLSNLIQNMGDAVVDSSDFTKPVRSRKKKRGFNRTTGVAIPKELLVKYNRGTGIKHINTIDDKIHKKKLLRKEKAIEWAEKQTARTEILLTESEGFLIPEEGETPNTITQHEIAKNVDISSATKFFELDMAFGPYRLDYTRNGRHLLIGGKKGHVAAFDWVTKRLHCELNVMEEVADVQWLHIETMFAVAQKNWVYMYDNQGVEIHCLKQLHKVLRMTFLPYHFLLATSGENGWLNWLDVSIGTVVSTTNTRKGRLSVMTQNPYNAVLCLGHSQGVVSMWSPTAKKPLVQMMCHRTGVQSISVDQSGKYMVTTSADREMRVWDIRALTGPISDYKLRGSPIDTSISQKGCLALAINNVVEVYKNYKLNEANSAYLVHKSDSIIDNIEFCPYEDVLGFGSRKGFTSILVPGAGEPNFDALEVNPLQVKSQRREAEVKSLLEKIQPELICLDPTNIAEVHVPSLKERLELKTKILDLKPQHIDFQPRKKKRGNTARAARVKKIVRENYKKDFVKNLKSAKEAILEESGLNVKKDEEQIPKSVLDRFKPKKK